MTLRTAASEGFRAFLEHIAGNKQPYQPTRPHFVWVDNVKLKTRRLVDNRKPEHRKSFRSPPGKGWALMNPVRTKHGWRVPNTLPFDRANGERLEPVSQD